MTSELGTMFDMKVERSKVTVAALQAWQCLLGAPARGESAAKAQYQNEAPLASTQW